MNTKDVRLCTCLAKLFTKINSTFWIVAKKKCEKEVNKILWGTGRKTIKIMVEVETDRPYTDIFFKKVFPIVLLPFLFSSPFFFNLCYYAWVLG